MFTTTTPNYHFLNAMKLLPANINLLNLNLIYIIPIRYASEMFKA